MKLLLTICAREGSKRIPGKNIRPLCGKPLIVHSIEHGLKWGGAEDVVVSTDSIKIAELAKAHGAKVPFIRPAELASDSSGKVPVIRHALVESERIFSKKYDAVIDLDVTNPLRARTDIEGAVQTFKDRTPKVVISVVKAHANPYFNMLEDTGGGFVTICKEGCGGRILRHQDAPGVYSINTSIYIYDAEFLRAGTPDSVITDRTAVFLMSDVTRYDIDNETDFEWIEFLMSKKVYPFE